jgi:hypothetical protein
VARSLLRVIAAAQGNQEGLFILDGELRCERYNDAEFLGDLRASIAFSGDLVLEGSVTRIDVDSAETVADGSYVFRTGAGVIADTIYSWDVSGAALYDYAIPATTRATNPVLRNGYLWWLEWPIAFADPADVLLKRSRCDLTTDLATVDSFQLEGRQGNAGGPRIPLIIPLDGDLWFLWQVSNEDGEQWFRAFSKDYSTGEPANLTADFVAQFGAPLNDDWAEVATGDDPVIDGCAVYDSSAGKAYAAWRPSADWPGPGVDPWPLLWSMDSVTAMVAVWTSSDSANPAPFRCLTRRGDVAQVTWNLEPVTVCRHPVPDAGGFPEVTFELDLSSENGDPVALFYIG